MKVVIDRYVQFPNRYKLTNTSTGQVLGTFDFDEVTGTVVQVGTEINSELFDSIAADLANLARQISETNTSVSNLSQRVTEVNSDLADKIAKKVDISGGELKDTIVTFSDTAGEAANVVSGEKTSVLWSKAKNWFGRLKGLAFKDTLETSDIPTITKSKLGSGVQKSLDKADNAVSTTDFNASVNKIYYNLGIYDTVISNGDGTVTITRATGIVTAEDIATGAVPIELAGIYPDTAGRITLSPPNALASYYTPYWNTVNELNPVGDSTSNKTGLASYTNGKLYVRIKDLSNKSPTLQQYIDWFVQNKIVIQYELAVAYKYTEKAIENELVHQPNVYAISSGTTQISNITPSSAAVTLISNVPDDAYLVYSVKNDTTIATTHSVEKIGNDYKITIRTANSGTTATVNWLLIKK